MQAPSKGGAVLDFCEAVEAHRLLGGGQIDFKVDASDVRPFPDLQVKQQDEIVATGGAMPLELLTEQGLGGVHLSPAEWHDVISAYQSPPQQQEGRPQPAATAQQGKKPLVLIDVRNRKEVEFGCFEGALDSDTKVFSEWAQFARAQARARPAGRNPRRWSISHRPGARCEG